VGIDIGREYKRGRVHAGQEEVRRTVILLVGKEQGGVSDWDAIGRNWLGKESNACQ
jgi:hypothetical protein